MSTVGGISAYPAINFDSIDPRDLASLAHSFTSKLEQRAELVNAKDSAAQERREVRKARQEHRPRFASDYFRLKRRRESGPRRPMMARNLRAARHVLRNSSKAEERESIIGRSFAQFRNAWKKTAEKKASAARVTENRPFVTPAELQSGRASLRATSGSSGAGGRVSENKGHFAWKVRPSEAQNQANSRSVEATPPADTNPTPAAAAREAEWLAIEAMLMDPITA